MVDFRPFSFADTNWEIMAFLFAKDNENRGAPGGYKVLQIFTLPKGRREREIYAKNQNGK